MHLRPKGLLAILHAANRRFFIHFGEDHCRLSSDQLILEVPERKESLILAVVSNTLLFGYPDFYRARFECLWVDQLAYTSPWRKHFHEMTKELSHMLLCVSSIPTGAVSSLTIALSS